MALKRVPSPILSDEWILEVKAREVLKGDYLPVELIELINYWHSSEADTLFNPKDDETAFEASKNQMKLLEKAANDESTLRSIIDGLAPDDELPMH
jgi:hypothetical protein